MLKIREWACLWCANKVERIAEDSEPPPVCCKAPMERQLSAPRLDIPTEINSADIEPGKGYKGDL